MNGVLLAQHQPVHQGEMDQLRATFNSSVQEAVSNVVFNIRLFGPEEEARVTSEYKKMKTALIAVMEEEGIYRKTRKIYKKLLFESKKQINSSDWYREYNSCKTKLGKNGYRAIHDYYVLKAFKDLVMRLNIELPLTLAKKKFWKI